MTIPPTSQTTLSSDSIHRLRIGDKLLSSRVIVGTGKYETNEQMRSSLDASGSSCVTVAVRREKLYDRDGLNLLDFIDLDRFTQIGRAHV